MKEIWHSISYNKGIAQGSTVWADAYIGAASPWFSGHFPDEPILPGIAILSMVSEVIRQVASERGGGNQDIGDQESQVQDTRQTGQFFIDIPVFNRRR
jgi:hypothetical protein